MTTIETIKNKLNKYYRREGLIRICKIHNLSVPSKINKAEAIEILLDKLPNSRLKKIISFGTAKRKITVVLVLGFIFYLISLAVDFADLYDRMAFKFGIKKYYISQLDKNIKGLIFDGKKLPNDFMVATSDGDLVWAVPLIPYMWVSIPFDVKLREISPYKIRNEKEGLFFEVKIFDKDEKLVGEINKDKFVLNKNNMFSWNQDDSAFEVVDNYGNVVFSVEVLPPKNKYSNHQTFYTHNSDNTKIESIKMNSDVIVNGYFIFENKYHIINTNKLTIEGNHSKAKKQIKDIKRIFEYSGPSPYGKRITSNL